MPFTTQKSHTAIVGKLCGENRDISRKVHKQMVFIIHYYILDTLKQMIINVNEK